MVLDIAVASDGGQNKRTLVKLDKVDLQMCRAGDHGHIGTWSDMSTAISVTWSEVSINMVRPEHGPTGPWSDMVRCDNCLLYETTTYLRDLITFILPSQTRGDVTGRLTSCGEPR